MSSPVGRIVTEVATDTSAFLSGLKKAGDSSDAFHKKLAKGVASVTKWAAATSAAVAGGLAAMVVQGMKAVDVQAKQARAIDGTTAALEGLKRAAADAGLAEGQVEDASAKLVKRLGEAQRGTGEAADALERLGLRAKDLAEMDADERMAAISDAMIKGGLSTSQMADSLAKLGVEGKEVVLLMQGGGDAIRAATAEMERYGVAVSDVDAAQVEAANDAWSRLGEGMRGVINQIGVKAAPYVAALADELLNAGFAGRDMGATIDTVIERIGKGLGWVLDRVADFKLGILGLSLAGQVIRKALIDAIAAVGEGMEAFAANSIRRINDVIDGLNRISIGVKFDRLEAPVYGFLDDMEQMSTTAEEEIATTREALRKLANEPMPSEALDEWVAAAKKSSREAAEAVVQARREQQEAARAVAAEGETAEEKASREAAAKEAERRREAAAKALEGLEAHLRSEVEAEVFAHQQRLAALDEALAQELLTRGGYAELLEALEAKHQERLTKLTEDGAGRRRDLMEATSLQQASAVAGALSTITSTMDKENRAQFAIQKGAAIASALISGAEGVARTLGEYPFPVNLAMAAPHAAAAIAQVAAIKSQSFGGGGSVSAPSGGGAGGGGGIPSGTLTVRGLTQGSMFSGSAVADLAERLLDYQKQGGTVVLEGA